jgi:hypothetical protein
MSSISALDYISGLDVEHYVARRIASVFDAGGCPAIDGVKLGLRQLSSGRFGGDFHAIWPGLPGQTTIVLGDVHGETVHAALVKALIRGALRTYGQCGPALCEVLVRLDELISRVNAGLRGDPVTCSLVYCVIDRERHMLEYCNGGHVAPIVQTQSGGWMRLEQTSSVLGCGIDAGLARAVDLDHVRRVIFWSDGFAGSSRDASQQFENVVRAEGGSTTVEQHADAAMRFARTTLTHCPVPLDDFTVLIAQIEPAISTGDVRGDALAMPLDSVARPGLLGRTPASIDEKTSVVPAGRPNGRPRDEASGWQTHAEPGWLDVATATPPARRVC